MLELVGRGASVWSSIGIIGMPSHFEATARAGRITFSRSLLLFKLDFFVVLIFDAVVVAGSPPALHRSDQRRSTPKRAWIATGRSCVTCSRSLERGAKDAGSIDITIM